MTRPARTLCLILSLSTAAVLAIGCGNKPAPKSTTTTRMQTNTQEDTGQTTATDVTTKTTEMPDGSKAVESTEKTNTTSPAP